MKSIRFKKKWVEDFNKTIVLNEEVSVLYEFYKEGEIEENEVIELLPVTMSTQEIAC